MSHLARASWETRPRSSARSPEPNSNDEVVPIIGQNSCNRKPANGLLYVSKQSYYFQMKNGSKSILQPLPVDDNLQGLIREASQQTHLSQAEVMRQALRIGVPELVNACRRRASLGGAFSNTWMPFVPCSKIAIESWLSRRGSNEILG